MIMTMRDQRITVMLQIRGPVLRMSSDFVMMQRAFPSLPLLAMMALSFQRQ